MLYVLAFALGMTAGIWLMIWRSKVEEKLVEQYESEKDVLANQVSSLCDMLQTSKMNEAYRNGYEDGRMNPYDEAERFARNISSGSQNVKFQYRGQKEGEK